jgi:hypothetical protein
VPDYFSNHNRGLFRGNSPEQFSYLHLCKLKKLQQSQQNMKTTAIYLACIIILFLSNTAEAAKNRKQDSTSTESGVVVLVVGFGDNVNSNYFPRVDMAVKMGVAQDKIDSLLNHKLWEGFAGVNLKNISFINPSDYSMISKTRNYFQFTGDPGDIRPELISSFETQIQELLEIYNADYLLLYNQYYLRWQEEPVRTLFHIFNYTIFNRKMQAVSKGQEHFNTFSLVNSDEMKKLMQRMVKKNTQNVSRLISK